MCIRDSTIDTIREKILRIKQIVNDGMLKSYALPKDTEEGIVAFIDEYKRQLREISLRTVLKIADLAKSFPDNWQEMAKQTVLKPVYWSYNKRMKKYKRNWLERKLDEYNHTMELIRTILPIAILIIQVIILLKVL